MEWDATLKLADVAIICATLLGPIFAVQVQKFFEARRERAERKAAILRTLLTSAPLSYQAVQALNGIRIEFEDDSKVLEAWRNYIDSRTQGHQLSSQAEALYVDLLYQMSKSAGYKIDRHTLTSSYNPMLHGEIERQQEIIREGVVKLFTGQGSLPLDLRSLPADPQTFAETQMLRQMLIAWLEQQGVERPKS